MKHLVGPQPQFDVAGRPTLQEFQIVDRIARGHVAHLVTEDARVVSVRRFAPVGKSDRVLQHGDGFSIRLARKGDLVPLTPAWTREVEAAIHPPLKITIKEIETEEELAGYDRLTQFHYRGAGGVGRRVPLVAVVDSWELPKIAGFIELTSTFLVNTARGRILNARFTDPQSGIAWSAWDSQVAKKYSNAFVRISRCVVYPELRGIGLSKALVDAAVEYARTRWHIAGMRPLFIEITAEMLRYWPFVAHSGFTYIGDTEGNGHRAAKDMQYLLSKKLGDNSMPKGGGGIMSAQRAYATTLAGIIDSRGLSITDVVHLLQRAPESLSDDEWIQLHKVYRRPKPTYMKGLTPAAEEFVRKRSGLLLGSQASSEPSRPTRKPQTPQLLVQISGLSVRVTAKPTSSARARRVQEAFGIVAKEFATPIVQPFDFTLAAGQVVLVTGPSGAGKSLLLRALRYHLGEGYARGRLPAALTVGGTRETPRIPIDWPRPIDGRLSPIELLHSHSIEEALQALATAGLAEAQLFVRPARTLSAGQLYRLGIALALASRPALLLIDEFCEPLDRFTAVAVSKQIRSASNRTGLGVIVASADASRVIPTLQPDRVVRLSWNGDVAILTDWRTATF